MSSSTTKCVIRIDENGPRVESNGNTVASDLKLTLKDYIPEVKNWTTWNGILNKGDEINISTPYKFIAVRARNTGTTTGSTINPPTGEIDLTSACLPANNSLASNCGCSDDAAVSSEVLLDFEMNQYTTYELDTKTIYSTNPYIFDCSHGATAAGVTGWNGCVVGTTEPCGVTGATGATGSVGITGGIGGTCVIGATTVAQPAQGVYEYLFTGLLKDNNLVIKTEDAECDYKCKLDYYAYIKKDNDYVMFIWDDTAGKWVIVRLDVKISEVVENKTPYNIIELIEWSTTNYTYKDSNITMPSIESGATAINSYEGSVTEQDVNMPVVFKMNSLFIMESKTFTGKITSRLNNLDVNVMLAV
jgi:hypothetical protein